MENFMPDMNITKSSLISLPQKPESWYFAVRQLRAWLELGDGTAAHPYISLLINLDQETISGVEIFPDQPSDEQMLGFLFKIIGDPPHESMQEPHRPTTIYIEDQGTTSLIPDTLADLEIKADVQSPPPHIPQLIAEIEDILIGPEPSPPGLLTVDGITPAMIGDMFSAAADFYKSAPWDFLSDIQPLKVYFEQLGKDGYIQLMGHAGLEFGLILYWDWEDLLHTYQTAETPLEQVPPGGWRSFTFENADLLPWDDLQAIKEHAWKIANENAFPLAITYTRTEVMRPPPHEIGIYEALLRAIPMFVDESLSPDDSGGYYPAEANFQVTTHTGPMNLEIKYPAGKIPDDVLSGSSTNSHEHSHHN
jgi:hypothetical protein